MDNGNQRVMARPFMLLGAPVEAGAGRLGCAAGPGALRQAGLAAALAAVGAQVIDGGDIRSEPCQPIHHPNSAIHHLAEVASWTVALAEAAFERSASYCPIFLGGDHSLAAGTVSGMARRAAAEGRPLFVLWLDAHADFHTLETTTSGNLHGVPMAYLTGLPGFDGFMPGLTESVDAGQVCLLGVRSVDAAEHHVLRGAGVVVHGMKALLQPSFDPLRGFLDRAAAEDALLHVSLDADVLDPAIAPGVGTAVPGGAMLDELHRVLDLVRASGLLRSLDLVEVNPGLDHSGQTAAAMVALAATLCGGEHA